LILEISFRPPSIFDIDVSFPKRFCGYEPPEPSIDDMIEDSDDGEEILKYTSKEPELRYRRDTAGAEISYQHFFRAWCMTWARRKKVSSLTFCVLSLKL